MISLVHFCMLYLVVISIFRHVLQRILKSAPMRKIVHWLPPQACFFFVIILSFTEALFILSNIASYDKDSFIDFLSISDD